MASLYVNPSLRSPQSDSKKPYSGYEKPDTKIPPKSKPLLDRVSVNGVEIPESAILAEAQHHPADNPGGALQHAVWALIVRELLLQRAKQLNLSTEDANPSETPQDALIGKLIDCEIDVPTATEEECLRYYRNNKSRFFSTAIYEASHILLAYGRDGGKNRQKRAAKAAELIDHLHSHPEDFERLAREFSSCPSAEHGGNLGQLTRGSTVDVFEHAIENAEGEGLLPHPVESKFGFHIIRLDRIIPGSLLPFESVEKQIASWLEAASWSKAVSQYVHLLVSEADISGANFPTSGS